MSIETDVIARLNGFAGLSALVSTRIYVFGAVPEQVERPYITYSFNILPEHAFVADALYYATVQIDCFDQSYTDAKAVAAQVKAALDRWSGTNTVTVQETLFNSEQDDYESDMKDFRIIQEYTLSYS